MMEDKLTSMLRKMTEEELLSAINLFAENGDKNGIDCVNAEIRRRKEKREKLQGTPAR